MLRGGLFLIGLGTLLQAVQLLGIPLGLAAIASGLGIILTVPWVFLWAKRFRGGGYNAVLCILPIIAFPILSLIFVIIGIGDIFVEAMSAGMALQGDQTAAQEAMEEVMMAQERRIEITSLVMPIFASLLILFGTNSLIKVKRV